MNHSDYICSFDKSTIHICKLAYQSEANVAKSFLSEDLVIDGNINSKGDLEIKGSVTGDINAGSISVLELGKVQGAVKGQDITVNGTVTGKIEAEDLTLSSSANVSADVTYGRIATEKGARITGKLALKP
ncbi:MAG TPA: hypothetical protein DEA94_13430 [Rhodobacteraceae bacterium]|nr:hypothetical protein [Paracoccaceae bacterium]